MPPPPCRPGTGTFQGCGAGPPPCCCRASSVLLRAWSLITVRGGLQMGKARVQNLPPPPPSFNCSRQGKTCYAPPAPTFFVKVKTSLAPLLSLCLSVSLSLSVSLTVFLSVYLSVCLSVSVFCGFSLAIVGFSLVIIGDQRGSHISSKQHFHPLALTHIWEWSLITGRVGRGLKDVGMCVCVGYLYRHLWNLIGD